MLILQLFELLNIRIYNSDLMKSIIGYVRYIFMSFGFPYFVFCNECLICCFVDVCCGHCVCSVAILFDLFTFVYSLSSKCIHFVQRIFCFVHNSCFVHFLVFLVLFICLFSLFYSVATLLSDSSSSSSASSAAEFQSAAVRLSNLCFLISMLLKFFSGSSAFNDHSLQPPQQQIHYVKGFLPIDETLNLVFDILTAALTHVHQIVASSFSFYSNDVLLPSNLRRAVSE